MELRRIRYFVAVAEELHFGRAATNLGIAQPALSLQISALENELGLKLLARSTRRVELTEAGKVFYNKAHGILNQVSDATLLLQATADNQISSLNIGAIYPATFGVLPHFLTSIDRKFPGIQINIQTGTTESISREIERGNIHIGFLRRTEKISSMRYHNISTDNYLLAIPKDNPLSEAKIIALGDLRGQKIIGFENTNILYVETYFKAKFIEHNIQENVVLVCRNTLSMTALITAGFGVGFVPEWASDFPNRNFTLRKVEGINLKISLGAAWRKDDPIANNAEIMAITKSLTSPSAQS